MSNRLPCSMACLALLVSASLAQKAEIRIDSGTAPASMESYMPVIAASESAVYAVWTERRHQEANGDIFFNRSLDGGATWLAEPLRLDRGSPPEAAPSGGPQIAVAGSAVYVVWSDWRSGESDLYFDRSLDNGTTWLPAEVRILGDVPGAGPASDHGIAAEGSTVHVVWLDSFGPRDVHHIRSLDGGLTWPAQAVRLDTDPVPRLHDSYEPVLAAANGAVYVAWRDRRNGNPDVYFNRSLDGGEHWLPSDVRLDLGTAPGASNSFSPALAVTESSVVVAWDDWRFGPAATIHANHSLDGGSTWLASDYRLDVTRAPGDGGVFGCRLAASGAAVYATWSLNRGLENHVSFNRSLDGGITWSRDRRLNHPGGGPGVALGARIAVAGSAVYVAWLDRRSGVSTDIYFNRSLDRGTTWLPVDARLSVDHAAGSTCDIPDLTASGGSVYVVWPETRSDWFPDYWQDVYFNLALGHQPYGKGTPGAGRIVPALACAGDAAVGGTLALEISRGRPQARGWLVLGFAGPTSLPFLGGALLVQPPLLRKTFQLDGPKGQPGAGSASIPLPIPPDTALLGLRVNFQAFISDPAAPAGVSMSAGVETWIL